jgi:hypothetical protein
MMVLSEQSIWEFLAAGITASYIRLVGISLPSSPLGPTLESYSVSVKVYLVINMAHASRAPSRHADLFQIQKHFVASLIFSMRSVMRLGVSSSGHNTEHILEIRRRARRWTS